MTEYRLTKGAEADLRDIARHTLKTWGEAQQRRYETAPITCFETLAEDHSRTRRPFPHRPDLLQVRCQHHHIFALKRTDEPLIIVAVLHEKMDIVHRLFARIKDSKA